MSNGQLQKPDNPDDLREEARLEESLEHLKELYMKTRAHRGAIPRLVAPLHPAYSSPDAFFSSFRKSVEDGSKEISEVKAALTSEPIKKIIQEADASQKSEPKGIKPWRASDYPNWTSRAKKT